jgi:hypothetical protein
MSHEGFYTIQWVDCGRVAMAASGDEWWVG